MLIELLFGEVRVGPLDAPVLVLEEHGGTRILPIWITATAGAAILSAAEEDPDHPSTHELLSRIIASSSADLKAVRILGVTAGVYAAELDMGGYTIPCRPSDAVALALRCNVPIVTTEEVLSSHGCESLKGVESTDDEGLGADEVELFRAFLDHVRAEDFEEPPE